MIGRKEKGALVGLVALMMAGLALAAPAKDVRWSCERAKAWHAAQPWYCGVNYIPANAINYTAMWDKTSFSPEVMRRELRLATEIGMNCVRVIIQYKVFEDDPAYLLKVFDQFLAICDAAKIKVVPVFFDDCQMGVNCDPVLGKQPEPLEGWYSWAWSPSPGHTMVIDARTHPLLEKFVKTVMAAHRDDPRILFWDLYNEPTGLGMGKVGRPYSIALLKKVFAWAHEINPSQPITSGVWNGDKELNDVILANSDIVTFHCYQNRQATQKRIDELSRHGRPVICTEWMNRLTNCRLEDVLPVYAEKNVGCMLWGLVNGKTQTHLPWGHRPSMLPYKGEWQVDLFRGDFTPYHASEIETLKKTISSKAKSK